MRKIQPTLRNDKSPNDIPHFYDRNGNIVSKNDTDKVIKNGPTQTYFTSLIKTKKMDFEHPDRLKRFTYVIDQPDKPEEQEMEFECYLNPSSCTLNERCHREACGEIIFGQWVRGKSATHAVIRAEP